MVAEALHRSALNASLHIRWEGSGGDPTRTFTLSSFWTNVFFQGAVSREDDGTKLTGTFRFFVNDFFQWFPIFFGIAAPIERLRTGRWGGWSWVNGLLYVAVIIGLRLIWWPELRTRWLRCLEALKETHA